MNKNWRKKMKIIGFVLTFALAMTSAYAKTLKCPPIDSIKCKRQIAPGGWNCSGADGWNAEDVHWIDGTFPKLNEGPTPSYNKVSFYEYPICTYSAKGDNKKGIFTVNLSNSKLEEDIRKATPVCKIDKENNGFNCSFCEK